MHLRFAGDDRLLLGQTALDCLRYHCHGDHSAEGQRSDVDEASGRNLHARFILRLTSNRGGAGCCFREDRTGADLLVDMRINKPPPDTIPSAPPPPADPGVR
jgi:hypothetical protein